MPLTPPPPPPSGNNAKHLVDKLFLLGTLLALACSDDKVQRALGLPRLDPETLDTGKVRVGGTPLVRELLLKNGAPVPLEIASVRIENDSRGAYEIVQTAPPDDPSRAEKVVTLIHRPAATPGSDDATLVVEFQNANPLRLEAKLVGETLEACGAETTACGGECVDTATSANHCGACNTACPPPAHAAATCIQGKCGRGPCDVGFFDIDGATTVGCESTCTGKSCLTAAGQVITLDALPLPEWRLNPSALVSAGTAGSTTQTSSSHTNIATLGEPTPPPPAGVRVLTGGSHKLVGGINAVHTRP
jgi:hypothetical protein